MIESESDARAYVAKLGNAEALSKLDALSVALIEENEKQNLVSRGTLAKVWTRHVADSAQLLRFVPPGTQRWLDLGTGAGFPGLVIAILRPEWPLVLVEARRKRFDWLERMRTELHLTHCRIEGRRIETVDAFPAAVISARAFAPLPRLMALSRRFSTTDTLWLLPKGRSAEQELHDAPTRWRGMFHVEQSLTDADARILVGEEANLR